MPRPFFSVLRAGVHYFALVFGAGFLLGMIRVPLLVPRLGARAAELLETPVMLVIVTLASRAVVRRFALTSARAALAVGLLALTLLVAAELALAMALNGSVSAYIASRDPISGAVYLVSLGFYAAMPVLRVAFSNMKS